MKLPQVNKENGIILLVILLIGAWIGVKFFTPEVIEETTSTETITTDTTFNIVDTTFAEVATPKKKFKPKAVRPAIIEEDPEPEKYDSVRSYTGTYLFNQGKFDWKIDTGGILKGYEFNPVFEIPTISTVKEKTITQTRTIIQKGVFVGGGVNTQRDFHFGASYLGKKFLIEYNFTPAMGYNSEPEAIPIHQLGVKYKIF